MKENKKLTSLIFVVALAILIVAGGTFAYVSWQTSTAQATLVNVTATDDIRMIIDDTTISSTQLYPTSDCKLDASMQGVANVTVINNTGVLASPNFKLKVKIEDKNGNIITNNDATGNAHEYRYYIKYAVGEENDECTEPLFTGRFELNAPTKTAAEGWYDSGAITLEDANGFPIVTGRPGEGVSFYANKYATTTHKYKVWAWIDQDYVAASSGTSSSDLLQDAKITVSWSENSIVEQVRKVEPEGEAIAIHSIEDYSLRFYRVDDPTTITVGSEYNDLTVTEVYTGFETASYTSSSQVPWKVAVNEIDYIYFEDYIYPVSTAYWFSDMYFADFDMLKLNTSNVTNMSYMFQNVMHRDLGTSYTYTIDFSNFDTSNVTNMNSMFDSFKGLDNSYYSKRVLTITGLDNWDVSNVTNMSYMFRKVGYGGFGSFTISSLEGWDTSNVTNMRDMFSGAGAQASSWSIGDLSGWDTSKVTRMTGMFSGIPDAGILSIGDISGWNVCRVTSHNNFISSSVEIEQPNWEMACPS